MKCVLHNQSVVDCLQHITVSHHNLQFPGYSDARAKIGEDGNKIGKSLEIVTTDFVDIYKLILIRDNSVPIISSKIDQDNTNEAMYHELKLLHSEILNNFQNL
uniref:CPSF_A domain-containing protein n=1 Tax=Strongyloides venezuelensis TaxID=75913 RepID=A0A0K0G592_STRVS